MGKLKIRKVEPRDVDKVLEIFQSAKRYMKLNNNPNQWSGEYPGKKEIEIDMSNGQNYVGIDEDGEIVMTFTLIFGEDPTYKIISEGNWLNDSYYATIHRIASNGKVSGVVKEACEFAFKNVDNIRIDTHEDNHPMQKALYELGFTRCGVIICRNGTPRIAFQKTI